METTQQRRLRVRKPLSDGTNTLNSTSQSSSSSSSSFALLKRKNPNLSSAFKRLLSDTNPNSKSTTTATAKSADQHDVVPKPSSTLLPPVAASTPPRPLRSSSSASVDRKVSEPCSVYTRRQTAEKRKSKGKTIAEPSTCIPTLKTRKIGREKIKEDGGDSLPRARTVPRKKKQRQIPCEKDVAMDALPRDFIEQQRAYFAEIDAFELPEEEVDSVEELD